MTGAILIVGGYGAVGTVIASQLAQRQLSQLIIAGRSAARAAQLAAELGPSARWRVLDVTKPIDYDQALAGVRLVIMCLDLPQIGFVRQCIQRGINYVDISAEYSILSAIAGLDQLARQHGATAVLSVGLVPGLSNLLARHSLRFVEQIEHFDSAIVAGLGEKHGAGATAWILSHLNDARGMTRIQLREPSRQKMVYRFAFSDQYTLPQTLPIGSAATWLGFDSFLMTHLIGLARLPIVCGLFQLRMVKQFIQAMTQRLHFGRDDFVLATRARGSAGIFQAWLRGKGQSTATGLVTAEVAHRIVTEQPPAGVFHIEQLFQLEDFLPLLERHGVTFAGSTVPAKRDVHAYQ
jgi:saccharopine dehydrogenase (NAD+, L-lysine forming)